jgi:hypothetical protein
MSSVADPDPGSGAFLTPRSKMDQKIGSGSGLNNPPGSYLLELFFGSKYLNSLMRIRDGKNSYPG